MRVAIRSSAYLALSTLCRFPARVLPTRQGFLSWLTLPAQAGAHPAPRGGASLVLRPASKSLFTFTTDTVNNRSDQYLRLPPIAGMPRLCASVGQLPPSFLSTFGCCRLELPDTAVYFAFSRAARRNNLVVILDHSSATGRHLRFGHALCPRKGHPAHTAGLRTGISEACVVGIPLPGLRRLANWTGQFRLGRVQRRYFRRDPAEESAPRVARSLPDSIPQLRIRSTHRIQESAAEAGPVDRQGLDVVALLHAPPAGSNWSR